MTLWIDLIFAAIHIFNLKPNGLFKPLGFFYWGFTGGFSRFRFEHNNREPQAKSVLIISDSQCILIEDATRADCRDGTGAVPYDDIVVFVGATPCGRPLM